MFEVNVRIKTLLLNILDDLILKNFLFASLTLWCFLNGFLI